MKRFIAMAGVLLALTFAGCSSASSPTPPLAPGYSNMSDQVMGQTIATAHAFYNHLQKDTISGKYIPSQAEKTALNAFAVSLNATQMVYLAYHNNTATYDQAQSSVTSLKAQQDQLQAQLGAGVN